MNTEKTNLGAVSGSGLSKVKRVTGWYMLVSTILSGGVMFCIGQMFGTHSSSKTTEIYTHVSNGLLRKIKLPI